MGKLILQIIAGIAGLWLATQFVAGVTFTGKIQSLLLAGAFLGLVNFFIKPILKVVTLPLRILTLGLFTIIINMAMIWVVDIVFPELIIKGIAPLFWTTLIVFALTYCLGIYSSKRKENN